MTESRKSMSEIIRTNDLSYVQSLEFRRLLAFAHAEGRLAHILQSAGIRWILPNEPAPKSLFVAEFRHAVRTVNTIAGKSGAVLSIEDGKVKAVIPAIEII